MSLVASTIKNDK